MLASKTVVTQAELLHNRDPSALGSKKPSSVSGSSRRRSFSSGAKRTKGDIRWHPGWLPSAMECDNLPQVPLLHGATQLSRETSCDFTIFASVGARIRQWRIFPDPGGQTQNHDPLPIVSVLVHTTGLWLAAGPQHPLPMPLSHQFTKVKFAQTPKAPRDCV